MQTIVINNMSKITVTLVTKAKATTDHTPQKYSICHVQTIILMLSKIPILARIT